MKKQDGLRLLEALLPRAKKAVEKTGTFVPFGAAIDQEGNLHPCESRLGGGERDVNKHVESLIVGLVQSVEGLRSFGVCINAKEREAPTLDAGALVQVTLEYDDRTAVDVVHPYERGKTGVRWGPPSEVETETIYFGRVEEDEPDRPQHQKDGDELLGFLVPFAQQCLDKADGFNPFAAGVTAAGKVVAVAAIPEEEEHYIRVLREAAARKKFRATGLCSNVEVEIGPSKEGRPAIKIALDSLEGMPVDCYIAYEKARGAYSFADLVGSAGKTWIFRKPR
jgi:hypothetical protein